MNNNFNRYSEFVFRADEGVKFEFHEGNHGELIIKAINVSANDGMYNPRYVEPPIPRGYRYAFGTWYNGFVIEKVLDGSQFVWIPVGSLDPDATLDGINFSEKFGRRNFSNPCFCECTETISDELIKQIESIRKYGGFYISRFNISIDENRKAKSIQGANPCICVDYNQAKKIAATMEEGSSLKSHLVYGAEYDSMLSWLIKSNVKSYDEVAIDSTKWGNYFNNPNAFKALMVTGSNEDWSANGIYDIAGNMSEWTQESSIHYNAVLRGGKFFYYGDIYPAAHREIQNPFSKDTHGCFRTALYIR